MSHVIQTAPTARSKCRGWGKLIAQGALRFGERIPNPFAKGETTLWFHLQCAAYKRPEALLEPLPDATLPADEAVKLRVDAERSIALHRLPRIDGADRASGARARCHGCREMIVKGEWRI